MRRAALVLAISALARVATAQPAPQALHDANDAALAGNWQHVAEIVDPLLHEQLSLADLAEAHRLAGLAAFFQHRDGDAEAHFVAYLRLDLDARLDPALVPPEAVTFFEDVRARHAAELRALRPRPRTKRYFVLELLPPFGQIQNGAHTKAWVIGGALATFAIANITSYLVLRSWCSPSDDTCDHHTRSATSLQAVNIISGIGLISTYVYGVYDGVVSYRRQSVAPFAAPTANGGVVGIAGSF